MMVELREDLQHTVDEFGRACGRMTLKINVSQRRVLSGQKGKIKVLMVRKALKYKEGVRE